MRVGRLLLRATVGGFFIGHGTQKLFGTFGGQGLKGTAEAFDGMGMKPGHVHATAAGVGETLGGAGILLGFQTPLAAASIVAVMATAINRVHLKNGPWAANGGYEYNAVLLAAAATLAETGPGPLSLDALRGKERVGAKWGLFALAAGAVGAAGAHVLAESRADKSIADVPPAVRDVVQHAAEHVADAAQSVHDAASDAAASVAETVQAGVADATDTVSDAADTVTEAADKITED
jgi:putative oxidoreductase